MNVPINLKTIKQHMHVSLVNQTQKAVCMGKPETIHACSAIFAFYKIQLTEQHACTLLWVATTTPPTSYMHQLN